KSSMMALKYNGNLKYKQMEDPDESTLMFDAFKYKTYHPAFPHEPTGDQFFDKAQWDAYYYLGREMGFSVLRDINNTLKATKALTGRTKTDIGIFDLFNVLK
ncbi:MAG: hypothetical protein JXQ77_04970, partial [Campylobacterales bacterium]|nr:hypothetical protein [Campylobacterales bacterium]